MPSTIEVLVGSGKGLGIGLHTIVIQKFWGGARVGCACGTTWKQRCQGPREINVAVGYVLGVDGAIGLKGIGSIMCSWWWLTRIIRGR